jgi:DNA-binding response OmpR family regulator/nitrogen-specific signal transduction histidine kinase
MEVILIIGAFILVIFLIIAGWLIVRRSLRIRNRLQMNRVFTNISHELLTPLTVISASVERLREQEPKYATDYALMELNVERMTHLLQEILETTKSQAGELRLLVSQGDVMEYIRQTAISIEPLMYKKGLEFSIHCTPQTMMGWIDTDKIDKVIYNLLSNAAKFTQTPGKVTLKAWTNNNFDQITIEVRDTGIGIPAEKIKNLFHRYYDGDYRWMQVKGTGLGLALTRDLIYLHNGTINCESEEGKGSVFTVTLPISKEAYAPSQIDEKHPLNPIRPNKTIVDIRTLEKIPELKPSTFDTPNEDFYNLLIVEDNEELLMLMKTLLNSKYNVMTASNGKQAMEIIQKEQLDMIISDVIMSEMDGNELTRQIKSNEEWSHLPIILISANNSEEARKESMLIGADDYITKPFRLGDLELRINNIIENRKRIVGDRNIAVQEEEEERPLTADEEFLQRARNCVISHLSDSDFDRDAFAADMGASASTLYNKLRTLTGQNITNFIREIRMKEAHRLAESQPDLRVSDLAYMVGFKDPKYFATCFKKEFGIQPSEVINKGQEKQ